jgi:hypothetical protein
MLASTNSSLPKKTWFFKSAHGDGWFLPSATNLIYAWIATLFFVAKMERIKSVANQAGAIALPTIAR